LTRTGQVFLLIFASVCSSVLTYILVGLLLPQTKAAISGSDAMSIANTYIVLTTLLMTLFAAFVGLFTYFLSQNSATMKMRELEDTFIAHLKSNDEYSKKLQLHADVCIKEAMKNFEASPEKAALVEGLIKAVATKLEDEAAKNSAAQAIVSQIVLKTGKGN
jgi:cytochrome c biogenesis factor